jgi:hypothetical protein
LVGSLIFFYYTGIGQIPIPKSPNPQSPIPTLVEIFNY